MASKKSAAKTTSKKSRSGKKTTPAVRYLRYELTNSSNAGTETSHFIDLARDLSAINRRLMRQGRAYHVKRISIVSSNTFAYGTHVDQSEIPGVSTFTQNAGRVTVAVAPDSWTVRNAWKRGFKVWNMHRDEASKAAGNNLKSKFDDFKVYLSNDHRAATMLVPKDNGGNNLQLGEWNYADVFTPDGTTSADAFQLHLLGNHVGSIGAWTSVGLVKSYGESRTTVDTDQPNVPATVANDPLLNTFDHGTVIDEVVGQMIAENDNPPYDVTNYPGSDGNMAKPIVVQQTTLGSDGRASVGGFTAICGVLELETTSPIADDVYSVLVELAPGNYRGIAADVI